jgi:hypothetical protein
MGVQVMVVIVVAAAAGAIPVHCQAVSGWRGLCMAAAAAAAADAAVIAAITDCSSSSNGQQHARGVAVQLRHDVLLLTITSPRCTHTALLLLLCTDFTGSQAATTSWGTRPAHTTARMIGASSAAVSATVITTSSIVAVAVAVAAVF